MLRSLSPATLPLTHHGRTASKARLIKANPPFRNTTDNSHFFDRRVVAVIIIVIMPYAPLLRFSDCTDTRAEAGEVMAGLLEVSGSLPLQRVFVRVYRTSSEHFAVLFPARAIVTACRPLASLNLRSCTVKRLPGRSLSVTPREGPSVTFHGADDDLMDRWSRALSEQKQQRKKVSDHRLPLPILIESEEEVETD